MCAVLVIGSGQKSTFDFQTIDTSYCQKFFYVDGDVTKNDGEVVDSLSDVRCKN